MPTDYLELRFFGPAEIREGERVLPRPRTQKELWILALLALRQGREVQRDWVAETLWPNSLTLKAQYNLRRALSDLRNALGSHETILLSPTVRTLRLDIDACWVDVVAFDEAIKQNDNPSLSRAVTLYTGPLLEGCNEDWVLQERRLRQEQCLVALETLASQPGSVDKRESYLRRALTLDPIRESVVRLLMQLLSDQGNQTGMTQLYRDLRVQLRDEFNTKPDAQTRTLYEELSQRVSHRAPSPKPIEIPLEPPGGPLPHDSPYYVPRLSDKLFREALVRGDSLALLKGPRQTGKSSLLLRGLHEARQLGAQTYLTAFQNFSPEILAAPEHLFPRLLPGDFTWDENIPPGEALEKWMKELLQMHAGQQVIWVLEGLDVVFSQPWHSDFFARLRFWHNERAFDPEGPWRRLTIALTYSTEVHLFITDPNQSPFNVGTRLFLADFSPEEIYQFHRLYKEPLRSFNEQERFIHLTGGHPYLTSVGLYALTTGQSTLEGLESGLTFSSPYRDHLKWLERSLIAPELREGARLALRGVPLEPLLFYRLRSAGILKGETPARAQLRCGLYQTFLEDILR